MEIEYVKGDATQPKADNGNVILLIHCCNDIGAWGAGFVLAINKRWSTPEAHYRDWSVGRSPGVNPPFALGNVQVVQVEQRLFIGNMIGQHGIGPDAEGNPPIRYEAIDKALIEVAKMAEGIAEAYGDTCEVHCPRFGAGLAGGDWNKIEAMLLHRLVEQGVLVTVYDYVPAAAPAVNKAPARLRMPTIKLGPRPKDTPRKSAWPRKAKKRKAS